ncbi:MAG: hypothetical protein M1825_002241 [Sarcosagium campestre]|nr:MAG: hypothetical protein M1825_002241 [Sarcosagium campestre]
MATNAVKAKDPRALISAYESISSDLPKLLLSHSSDALNLTSSELEILELQDQLEQLQIEEELWKTQNEQSAGKLIGVEQDPRDNDSDLDVDTAKQELLESKALYTLRKKIIDNVIITDPHLRAIHSGVNATPPERTLRPMITRRDQLSIKLTNLSAVLSSTMEALTTTEAENMRLAAENAELGAKLLNLADAAKSHSRDDIADEEKRSKIDMAEEEMKLHRTRWRIMKSVVAATIVSSGIDWARDEELRSLVLNNEDTLI